MSRRMHAKQRDQRDGVAHTRQDPLAVRRGRRRRADGRSCHVTWTQAQHVGVNDQVAHHRQASPGAGQLHHALRTNFCCWIDLFRIKAARCAGRSAGPCPAGVRHLRHRPAAQPGAPHEAGPVNHPRSVRLARD
jgi:hypothetical protein